MNNPENEICLGENVAVTAEEKRIKRILTKLERECGSNRECFLHFEKEWQLLFAVILSAQCTDARVNMVTKDLYKKYRTVKAFAEADLAELEEDIKSTGFYHNKAKNIKACAKVLTEKYGGRLPHDMESLTALPGVGRKTANVVRCELWQLPGIAVDTHVKRISKKLGLTESDDPVVIEKDLMKALPEDYWRFWNHDIITLGRSVCIAHREKCNECVLRDECPSAKKSEIQ